MFVCSFTPTSSVGDFLFVHILVNSFDILSFFFLTSGWRVMAPSSNFIFISLIIIKVEHPCTYLLDIGQPLFKYVLVYFVHFFYCLFFLSICSNSIYLLDLFLLWGSFSHALCASVFHFCAF